MATVKKVRKPRQPKSIKYRLDSLPANESKTDPKAAWVRVESFDSENDAILYASLHKQLTKNSFQYAITKVITILERKPEGDRKFI